ncbi:MAG: hypothetical protein M3417_10750 [Actinomycetota bacterium]|nr:hypothetical protein [Actinomycetota bacterium]
MSIVDLATVVAAVVAVIAVIGPVQGFLKRTVGRKRDLYRRLHRLGAGAQLSFFTSVIGEPPALRDSIDMDMPDWAAASDEEQEPPLVVQRFVRLTFVDPLFYLVAIADDDDAVLGFSITTRRRRFAPTFYAPRAPLFRDRLVEGITLGRRKAHWLVRFQLGRTTFADAAPRDWGIPQVQAFLGARTWSYSEAWYLGNPGHYLTYVFTSGSASPVGGIPRGLRPTDWNDQDPAVATDQSGEPMLQSWVESVRSKTRVNTVTVIKSPLELERWPGETLGPHGDEVRLLP